MRQRLLPMAVLAVAGLSLTSCGENGGEQPGTPPQAPASAQVVETLPIDDLAGQIEEMPDGIHLRPGYQDIAGYDVDSVYLTRKINGALSRNYYATSGPSALRGRADSTCPMTSAKVAGLNGATEVGFGTPIQVGDVITVVKSNNPGACEGSGTATLTLKRGSRTKVLGTYQNNISVTYC